MLPLCLVLPLCAWLPLAKHEAVVRKQQDNEVTCAPLGFFKNFIYFIIETFKSFGSWLYNILKLTPNCNRLQGMDCVSQLTTSLFNIKYRLEEH